MEGLEFPDTNKEKVYFIFFESNLYSDKINKRIAVTKDVLAKQGIKYTTVDMEGKSKLAQILIGMQRSDVLGLYSRHNPSERPKRHQMGQLFQGAAIQVNQTSSPKTPYFTRGFCLTL
jgi:hypothetical protein